MYDIGRPPAFLLGRSGLGALGDAETATECPQPVSTAERDTLREELGRYAGWGPGTYEQWHEGHPDLRVALDDIGGRMKGLYDRPKLLRCEKEARDRAQIWMGQLRDLLFKVKSAPNRGWDAAGYTYVRTPFTWSIHRGPTYTIRPTGVPGPVADAMYAFAHGGAPPPAAAATVQSSAPPGTVVLQAGATTTTPPAVATTTPPPAPTATSPPAQPVATVGGGGVWTPPAAYAPDFMAGELVPGLPNRYLVYGTLGLLAWRMVGR